MPTKFAGLLHPGAGFARMHSISLLECLSQLTLAAAAAVSRSHNLPAIPVTHPTAVCPALADPPATERIA